MHGCSALGLNAGDRIALNLPNIVEQIFYILAAQSWHHLYPVFGGLAGTLGPHPDAGAEVVITADGGYRNAEVVPTRAPTLTPRWTITCPDQPH